MLPKDVGAEALLFRRLFLGRRLLPSLSIPFAIGLIFTATFWIANSFALSGEQAAARELGRFEHAISLDLEPGDVNGTAQASVEEVLRASGVRESSVGFISSDVRPDQLKLRPTAGPQRVLSFTQLAAPALDFPARYSLASGRWPRDPGEVVLTPALRAVLGADSFTAFGGLSEFRVVGMFEDLYATDATAILAAPGTWESIPESASKSFAPQGALRILWVGSFSASDVDSSVRGLLALAPPPDGNRPPTDRAELVKINEQSLSDRQRLLFAYPLLLLSAMAGIAVVRSNRRWTRAYLGHCRDIGLRPSRIALVFSAVESSGVLIAAASGILLGAAVGWSAREWILPTLLTQPLGPTRSLMPIVDAALLACAVTLAVSTIDALGTATDRRWPIALQQQIPWSLLRRVLAGLALLHGVQVSSRPDVRFDEPGGSGVLITLAVVLCAPDFLRLARLLLPRKRPRSMVARRMIEADPGGLALVSIIVAASLAFPITMNSYNATVRRSNDAGFVSMVRPNQVWVDGTSPAMGDPRPIAAAVATAVLDANVIYLRFASAYVYPVGGKPVENTSIATVPTSADLIALLGDEPWVRAMAEFVERGGVGFVEGPARPVQNRDPDAPTPVDLPGQAFGPDSSRFAAPFAGVMLAQTARDAGLTSSPLATVFPAVTDAQADAAVAAVRGDGLDVRLLSFYTDPPETRATTESYFALAGLLTLAAFLLVGLMRAVGERMRARSAQFLAIGFRRRWSASVAALQLGLGVAAGLIAGALGSMIAMWVFASAPAQTLILTLPIGFIAWTSVLVTGVAAVGILTCVLRVRATSGPDF